VIEGINRLNEKGRTRFRGLILKRLQELDAEDDLGRDSQSVV